MSSERTLSSTSMSAVSLFPIVAELQDVSRRKDNSAMTAQMLRTVGYRLGLPTYSMLQPF
jgi:hypothetical protein